MADDNAESREQSGSTNETENQPDPGTENGSTKTYDSPIEVFDDPPEWMEKIQDDGGEVIPLGKGSRSLKRSYISITTSETIGISQKAMYKYFQDSNGIAVAIKKPKGGGSKKLYLKPIDNPEEFPLGKAITQKNSGAGEIRVGSVLNDYNLVPEKATQYELDWDEETETAVATISKKSVLD